nr:MAG TPA: hypothetical protein [Bacteriophage sp.]
MLYLHSFSLIFFFYSKFFKHPFYLYELGVTTQHSPR